MMKYKIIYHGINSYKSCVIYKPDNQIIFIHGTIELAGDITVNDNNNGQADNIYNRYTKSVFIIDIYGQRLNKSTLNTPMTNNANNKIFYKFGSYQAMVIAKNWIRHIFVKMQFPLYLVTFIGNYTEQLNIYISDNSSKNHEYTVSMISLLNR